MRQRILAALGAAALGLLTSQASAQSDSDSVVQVQASQSAPATPRTNAAPVNDYTSASASCCAGSCGISNCCAPQYSVFGSVGAYFLRPSWDSNPAFFRIDFLAESISSASFDWDYEVAPNIQLGIVNGAGNGFRVGGWEFDDSTSAFAENSQRVFRTTQINQIALGSLLVPAGPFAEAAFSVQQLGEFAFESGRFGSSLECRNWDFEAIQVVDRGYSRMTLAAGIRYGVLEQGYRGVLNGVAVLGNVGLVDVVFGTQVRRTFDGVGPTLAADYERRLGDRGLGIYGSARGCFLWGKQRDVAENVFAAPGLSVLSADRQTSNRSDGRSIIETELGVQFTRDMGRVGLVAQAGLAAMWFFEAGNASGTIFQNDLPNQDVSNTLSFFGGNLRIGFEF